LKTINKTVPYKEHNYPNIIINAKEPNNKLYSNYFASKTKKTTFNNNSIKSKKPKGALNRGFKSKKINKKNNTNASQQQGFQDRKEFSSKRTFEKYLYYKNTLKKKPKGAPKNYNYNMTVNKINNKESKKDQIFG